jgi:hypothetical protein
MRPVGKSSYLSVYTMEGLQMPLARVVIFEPKLPPVLLFSERRSLYGVFPFVCLSDITRKSFLCPVSEVVCSQSMSVEQAYSPITRVLL